MTVVDLHNVRTNKHKSIQPDGTEPQDPGMEPHVAALEADMTEVNSFLKGLELSSAWIEAPLANLSTKADSATAFGRIHVLDGRSKTRESAVSSIARSVDR